MELTKSEMREQEKELREQIAFLVEENNQMVKDATQAGYKLDGCKRQLDTAYRNFQQLWGDERTMRLRYDWLETAATDVVTACPKHLQGEINVLRDELGIETKETENGDT